MLPCWSCARHRIIHVAVVLLDGTRMPQEMQDDQPGKELLESVYRHLNLIETAYFGLRFVDTAKQTHWLDPAKSIGKQLKGADTLYFGVKFYAADPCKLLEEITRYQVFLQVKQDVLQGRLPVAQDLAAELGALVVQSELGDYDNRRHPIGYVSEFRLVAHQTPQFEGRVSQLHRNLIGLLPAEAELGYLEKVKWLDMYGVDLHPVLGEDNVDYFVGLTPAGLIVLRTKTKVANYYWPRITKLYFKGRYFMLRVKDKTNEESTYGFELPTRSACKHLWKCCVEHHAFFRLLQVAPATSAAPSFFTLGSRFRYSGRTEKQMQRDAQLRARAPPPQFSRIPSRRFVEGRAPTPPLPASSTTSLPPPPPPLSSLFHVLTPTTTTAISTSSIPNNNNNNNNSTTGNLPTPGEPTTTPTSTRSAPWARGGLYGATAASPRSVRSAGETHGMSRLTRRSSSVESQSSNDSRSCRHGRRRRHGSNRDGNRGPQVATAIAGGAHSAVAVVRRASGYQHSGLESDSERSSARGHRTRHRTRHRHRHHHRANAEELARHLQFELVDPTGLTAEQLREIPYKVVHTTGTVVTPPTVATAKRRRQRTTASSSPPPPYTPPPPPPPPPPLPVPSSTINQQQQQQQPQHQNQPIVQQQQQEAMFSSRTRCLGWPGHRELASATTSCKTIHTIGTTTTSNNSRSLISTSYSSNNIFRAVEQQQQHHPKEKFSNNNNNNQYNILTSLDADPALRLILTPMLACRRRKIHQQQQEQHQQQPQYASLNRQWMPSQDRHRQSLDSFWK